MAQCPAEECSCYATPDQPPVCECEIVYTDEVACAEELYEEIIYDLQTTELTPEQETVINDCVNAFVESDCLTEAQVQENIDAIEADQDPPHEHEIPIECEEMMAIFSPEPQPTEPAEPYPQPSR